MSDNCIPQQAEQGLLEREFQYLCMAIDESEILVNEIIKTIYNQVYQDDCPATPYMPTICGLIEREKDNVCHINARLKNISILLKDVLGNNMKLV